MALPPGVVKITLPVFAPVGTVKVTCWSEVGVHSERVHFHCTQSDRRGLNEAGSLDDYRRSDHTAGRRNARYFGSVAICLAA